jgi:hypothetical protein
MLREQAEENMRVRASVLRSFISFSLKASGLACSDPRHVYVRDGGDMGMVPPQCRSATVSAV